MLVRSHVDPLLFVRFMHIRGSDVPADLPELLAQAPDQARYLTIWRRQYEHSIGAVFHECYHFWQGARLPYLYWYAQLGMRAAFKMFGLLSRTTEDHHEWETVIPALYRLQMTVRCVRLRDGSIAVATSNVLPRDAVDHVRLSPLDLMEAAASIAEYQFLNGADAMADPTRYSRWRKRNRSYADIPAFVERVLEDGALALRCFVPMANAAFGTSDPPRAFAALLAALRGNLHTPLIEEFLAQREPCRWSELMDWLLERSGGFEAEPDSTTDLLDPPYCRLTMQYWLNMRLPDGTPWVHPILTSQASEWIRREAEDPVYGWLLDQPAWVGHERFWETVNYLGPPLTVVRFHLPGAPNRVFNVIDQDSDSDFLDLLTILAVIRRAGWINFDPDSRLCHHTACPEYNDNYCNAYSIIPEDYSKCGFLPRLEMLRTSLPNSVKGDTDP